MGKKIDGFVATILPGILVWLYLSKRIGSGPIAFAAAVLSCIVFSKLARRILNITRKIPVFHKRRIRRNSGASLMHIASLPYEQAHSDINILIQKCYPGSEYTLEVIQQHPTLRLSESAIFQAWKKHIGNDRLVICASCRTEPTVRAFASSFSNPKISLIDSDMLSQMISEFPDGMVAENVKKSGMRMRHALNLLVNRKNAPKNLLFSLTMLLMYYLTKNVLYLVSAIFLLLLAFLSLRRKLRPHKLF